MSLSIEENSADILRQRAVRLAKPLSEANSDQGVILDLIPFRLGEEIYGIELSFLRQVYPIDHYTPVPGVPDFILGISYVQGQVFSILDLKRFFSLPPSGITNQNKLVVLECEDMFFGILADEVYGVRTVPESSLGTPEFWKGSDVNFIRGVTPDRLIVIDARELILHPSVAL